MSNSKKIKSDHKKESRVTKLIDELEYDVSTKKGNELYKIALNFTRNINKFNRTLTDDHRKRFVSLLKKAGEIIKKEDEDDVSNKITPYSTEILSWGIYYVY